MDEYQSLSHTTWDCKYHVVFIPKCRRKTLYLELRRYLGDVFHKLAATTVWRSTSLSSPIVPKWLRWSSGCGTDDCGRTSAPSLPQRGKMAALLTCAVQDFRTALII